MTATASENTQERVNDIVHSVPEEFNPKRTICIPVDGSVSSKKAVDWAINHSICKETDQVVLLNVREVPHSSYTYPYLLAHESLIQLDHKLRTASHELLQETAKHFLSHQIHCRAVSLRGDPREELEFKISHLKPDLVIVGSRGLGPVSKLLVGSVSNHLVHHLHCPVVVVPEHLS
ncbi:hypothetical protein BC833DRAFT_609830 [Globomyces pollinis-pini]|nr:hypothetical protein BC833DRAFT_609830 [Globomyces pollinis-pini]